MFLYDDEKYINNIKELVDSNLNWDKLRNSNIMITGATGLIGKFLIDTIMYLNEFNKLNCKIIAVGRSENKFKARFEKYIDNENLFFLETNINNGINYDGEVDYLVHAASSTHPLQYSTFPIETILTNVIALKNLLELANEKSTKRVIFTSSVEVYGQNKGDVDKFDENYLGYIDCNTLRAGYPESKRVGEALCQAYIKEKNMDIVIPRLARVFGPTLLDTDSKALSQFIKKGVNREDIVLKSSGNQYFSYLYMLDAVKGILLCLFDGNNGEAYNICSDKFNITLKELATAVSEIADTNVLFELPDDIEKAGYSTATKAIMNCSKINKLGFEVNGNIKDRLAETILMMRNA